jgi:hypothetical protein
LLTATFRWGRGEKDNSSLGHLPSFRILSPPAKRATGSSDIS